MKHFVSWRKNIVAGVRKIAHECRKLRLKLCYSLQNILFLVKNKTKQKPRNSAIGNNLWLVTLSAH